LHALLSHLAFYAGDPAATDERSRTSLGLARASGDDRALVEALRARQEALPGPAGRAERDRLADEMVAAARRVGSPRAEMWARLWRVDVLTERGEFPAADRLLPELGRAVRASAARSAAGCTTARPPVSRKPSAATTRRTGCHGGPRAHARP